MARRTLTIKRIDPWSVLKVGFLANLVLLGILLLAGRVVWFFIERLELIGRACEVATSVGFEDCGLNGGNIFRNALLLGLLGVVVQTGILVFGSFLHNLIAELTGGLTMTVVDDGPERPVQQPQGDRNQRSGRPAAPVAAGAAAAASRSGAPASAGRPGQPTAGAPRPGQPSGVPSRPSAPSSPSSPSSPPSGGSSRPAEPSAQPPTEQMRPTPGSGGGQPAPSGQPRPVPPSPDAGVSAPRPTPGSGAGGPAAPRPGSGGDPTQVQRPERDLFGGGSEA